MSGEVERNFRAAIRAERARGAATVYGDLEIAGRTEDGDGLPGSSQSKGLSELPDFLAAHRELDGARLDRRGGDIFSCEIRYQVAERIHAQHHTLGPLACRLCFPHRRTPDIACFFPQGVG